MDRASSTRMPIKIKVTSMTRASRDYFKFTLKHTVQNIRASFEARILFIVKHALLDEVGTSNTMSHAKF